MTVINYITIRAKAAQVQGSLMRYGSGGSSSNFYRHNFQFEDPNGKRKTNRRVKQMKNGNKEYAA